VDGVVLNSGGWAGDPHLPMYWPHWYKTAQAENIVLSAEAAAF